MIWITGLGNPNQTRPNSSLNSDSNKWVRVYNILLESESEFIKKTLNQTQTQTRLALFLMPRPDLQEIPINPPCYASQESTSEISTPSTPFTQAVEASRLSISITQSMDRSAHAYIQELQLYFSHETYEEIVERMRAGKGTSVAHRSCFFDKGEREGCDVCREWRWKQG